MTTIDRPANAGAAADAAVKAKHRAMWASGNYPALAHDLIADLGAALVDACGVRPGMRVLDVAAGAGNAALVAADAGADVVAGDLTPELFTAGRAAAAERGVEVTWREADAEALPFADAAFDVVMSCVGVMFARATSRPRTNSCGSAVPAARSACLTGLPAASSGRCSP
jgi:2-polyprenyl-3-methyl-5-hydroxy-6-metoxy-1,4-benzoquinol methylase